MALIAAAKINNIRVSANDDSKLEVEVRVCVLNGDVGLLPQHHFDMYIDGVTAGSITLFNSVIKEAVKDHLIEQEVEFGLLDTLWMQGVGII